MPEPMKKYETLIEMAFQFVERVDPAFVLDNVPVTKEAFSKLAAAAEALKDFRTAGEPVFVLRAHDRVAPKAIVAWGHFVSSYSATGLAGEHASHESDKMLAWQEAHPAMVKLPD